MNLYNSAAGKSTTLMQKKAGYKRQIPLYLERICYMVSEYFLRLNRIDKKITTTEAEPKELTK